LTRRPGQCFDIKSFDIESSAMGTHYDGGADERRALDTFIKLMRAADSVSAAVGRPMAAAGLTSSQFGVLEALLHLGPLSQAGLAAKLLRSGSNITTVVDNLEARGLVRRTRRATDRRAVDVSLTAEGGRLIRRLFPTHARRITEAFATLSARDQERLGALCRTLGRSLSGGDCPS
jgi:MarR family 2-MHQ and catechol resistance regulon transcriptional repressor